MTMLMLEAALSALIKGEAASLCVKAPQRNACHTDRAIAACEVLGQLAIGPWAEVLRDHAC